MTLIGSSPYTQVDDPQENVFFVSANHVPGADPGGRAAGTAAPAASPLNVRVVTHWPSSLATGS